jgi:hypothetical protein
MKRSGKNGVFKKTYNNYLDQVKGLDLVPLEKKLGIIIKGAGVIVPLFGNPYMISKEGITDPAGKIPSFEVCVILFKYLLLDRTGYPKDKDWVSYRDLRDSGPLTVYFRDEVENAISRTYAGRLKDLKAAGEMLEGAPPDMDLPYDLSMKFDLLPRVPILLLFNDADDEFPSKCSVLFEKRAENYLDAECLAMAGNLLFTKMKEAEGEPA